MMARTQITLEREVQRKARQRASDLGISLAEYVRRLVVKDLGGGTKAVDPSIVFDLGKSEGSDIRNRKDEMIAAAFEASRRRSARR